MRDQGGRQRETKGDDQGGGRCGCTPAPAPSSEVVMVRRGEMKGETGTEGRGQPGTGKGDSQKREVDRGKAWACTQSWQEGRHQEGEGEGEGDGAQMTVRQREGEGAGSSEGGQNYSRWRGENGRVRQEQKGRVGKTARTGDEGVRMGGSKGKGVSWHLGQKTAARPDNTTPNCHLTV